MAGKKLDFEQSMACLLYTSHAHLAHIALKGALAQVGPEGVVQLLLPGSHCGPQGAEGLNARPGRQGRTALKIGPLPGDELRCV